MLKMEKNQMKTVQTHFNFSISVSDFEEYNTPEIIVGDIPWKIRIRKISIDGQNTNDGILNVFLMCDYKGTKTENLNWWIEAAATLRLINSGKSEETIEKKIPAAIFEDGYISTKLGNFVPWDYLIADENDFIKRGQAIFEGTIETSPLRIKKSKAPAFECTGTQFGFILENIKDFDCVHSSKINLHGSNWYFKFRKQDGNLNVILYNEREIENFAWTNEVNFKVKLLSFDEKIEPLEKSLKCRFDCDRTNWGWLDFIKWADLIDKKNSYVHQHAIFDISIEVGPWEPLWKMEQSLLNNSQSTKSECPICKEKFGDQEVMATTCGHLFCSTCIKTSIEVHKNDTCPLCKLEVELDDLRIVYLHS